jgi:hypothetical protein
MAEENQNQPAAEAPPVIDPRDEEIKQLKINYHQMAQSLETNNQLLQRMLQSGQQQPQAPTRRGPISEEELETAFQEGKGAAKMKELMNSMAQELVETHINPLRQTGLQAIAANTMEMLKPRMPHFDRYQKEIQVFLDAYPPDLRVNAQAIRAAYDTVVGSHLEELAEERVQQHIRQAAAPVVKPGGSQRGRGNREDTVAEADEIAPGALQGIGRTEEEFARKLGYKSWAEYQKVGAEEG